MRYLEISLRVSEELFTHFHQISLNVGPHLFWAWTLIFCGPYNTAQFHPPYLLHLYGGSDIRFLSIYWMTYLFRYWFCVIIWWCNLVILFGVKGIYMSRPILNLRKGTRVYTPSKNILLIIMDIRFSLTADIFVGLNPFGHEPFGILVRKLTRTSTKNCPSVDHTCPGLYRTCPGISEIKVNLRKR